MTKNKIDFWLEVTDQKIKLIRNWMTNDKKEIDPNWMTKTKLDQNWKGS